MRSASETVIVSLTVQVRAYYQWARTDHFLLLLRGLSVIRKGGKNCNIPNVRMSMLVVANNDAHLDVHVYDWELVGLGFDWDAQWTAELILLTDVGFLSGTLN